VQCKTTAADDRNAHHFEVIRCHSIERSTMYGRVRVIGKVRVYGQLYLGLEQMPKLIEKLQIAASKLIDAVDPAAGGASTKNVLNLREWEEPED
jgi:hypothetical protein